MKLMIDIDDVGWNDVVMGYMPGCKGLLMGVKAKEVISCKDCKYWDKEQTQCNYRLLTEDAHMKVLADDFCSRGEKR